MEDKIFLLSVEEYQKYKSLIPKCDHWWWLRSPGKYAHLIAYVCSNGSIYFTGHAVSDTHGCVRPVIHYKSFNYRIVTGDTIVTLGTTWKILDNNLAIAEMPIFFNRFNSYKVESNDYESSEVRKKLLAWVEERKNW